MEKKKPLLSICIPTYNREPYLKKLLDSIVSQKEFSDSDDVEIVIDDGPSKDNTTGMIEDYQKRFPNKIRYYRNDIAIGMCPAFLEAIEFSWWEYTRLFGSDDMMSSISLETILHEIKTNNPSIILSDRYVFSDESEIKELSLFPDKKDILLHGWKDFFEFLWKDNKENWPMNWNFFTFISIFCFKQEFYLKNKQKFLEKYGKTYQRLSYNYFNFALIPYFDIGGDKITIIRSKTLVFAKWWNHGWSFSSMDIFNDLYFLIKTLRKEYKISYKCDMFFNHMLLWRFLPSIMWMMKKNSILKYLYKPLMAIYNFSAWSIHKILRRI